LEAPCEEIIQIGCVLGKFHDEMWNNNHPMWEMHL
jgi:hypothetical protein